jgi:hypothetical protein
MSDQLLNHLSSPNNLKKAFEYIKLETKQSTLPLDPFWTPGIKAIDRLGDAFFNSLNKLLLENKYNPDDIYFFHQHKENYGIRKLAMISVVDRVVYQAILNPDILGLQLNSRSSFFSCYPGVTKNEKHYLEHYKKSYQSYWDFQKCFYEDNNMSVRGEYDIHCFFDNISHRILFQKLEEDKIGSKQVRLLLKTLFSKWFLGGRGIPQGPQVSSVIANYYLSSLDDIEFDMPVKKVGYVRYMDDISIMARSDQLLLEWVEKLTYSLDEIGLVLNSKTKKEKINSIEYFEDKGIAPYQSIYEEPDSSFFNKVLGSAPEIIGNLTNGEDVPRIDLSKLKYYLKASPDYSLAKEVILLYPNLPSFADIIARYLQPIGNEAWVQVLILKLLSEHHLFRWQKLWLAKLLLIEKAKGSSKYFEVDFRKSNNWELRSMAWLAEIVSGGNTSIVKFTQLVNQSENNFELAIYLSLIPMLKDKKAKVILDSYIKSSSLEIQTVVKSLVFDDEQLASSINHSNLFVDSKISMQEKSIELAQTIEDDLKTILGFSYRTTQPRKRFVFELKAEGDEVIMMGSILDGRSFSAFNATKTSAFKRIIKTLLALHAKKEKESFEPYTHQRIKDAHISKSGKEEVDSTDLVKEKRKLSPLCQELFGILIEQGQNKGMFTISFRSAINETIFDNLPDDKRKQIANLARQTLDSVKD